MKLTRRCNLKCLQCEVWKTKPRPELSTEQWKRIILDVKKYIGPYFIRFYGGEPFCRKDLLELLEFCDINGLPAFITTNGTCIDRSVAQKLAQFNVLSVNISLDGHKPEIHDRLRGMPGTYKRVIQAIEFLKGKVSVCINTTIMDYNIDAILPLAEFAHKNKLYISLQGVSDTVYKAQHGNNKVVRSMFPRDSQKLDYIIDSLINMKKNNESIMNSYDNLRRLKMYFHRSPELTKKRCEAIGRQLMIKDQGNVYLCSYNSSHIGSIGNVAERSLRDIWNLSKAKKKKSEMAGCKEIECLVIRGCYKESLTEKLKRFKKCFSR
ncbi:MAG: radical SAM protein [Candidatus Omnitrophota bacterium]